MPKNLHTLCTLFIISLYFLETCKGISVLELNSVTFDELGRRDCEKKVGEVEMGEEMMDSEINRRILLMGKRYISYDTLRRDLVPCDRPGASYYNCKGPDVANSYNRGCEVITRCARVGQ